MPLLDIIKKAPLQLYEMIFKQAHDKRHQYLNYFEKKAKFKYKDYFREEKGLIIQRAAVFHSANEDLFNDILRQILQNRNDKEMDYGAMTKFVADQFLGIMVHMDSILGEEFVDRKLKEMVIRSVASLLRLIGSTYASDYCFKIMGLLKATGNLRYNAMYRKIYIDCWNILVRTCNPQAVGPFLSGIFVALESYIVDFPNEVEIICNYLIEENQSILGKHLADLFFIDRTKYPDRVKEEIVLMIESQLVTTGSDFETKLKRIIRHMRSESADSDVKNYCLQYLHEYSKNNRSKINELIYEPKKNDVKVSDVLCVLLNCFRNKSSQQLMVQAAVCLGEIGALKPDFCKDDEVRSKDFGFTVHSDDFALYVLNMLCKDYKDLHHSDHMEFTAASIQGIIAERKMTPDNSDPVYRKLSSTNQKVIF